MPSKVLLALISIISSPAFAVVELTEHISFSGFGSTSWAQSDNDTPVLINRAIRNESCFDCDTTFGLQLDYYNEGFKASVQGVKRPQDNWSEPALEWAYVGYEFDHLDLRAGRQRLPLFLASEYFYVAQAFTTARPPAEVYSALLGLTAYNGASVNWRYYVTDELQLSLTPFVGFQDEAEVTFNPDITLEFDTQNLWGLNAQLTGDFYRWNFTYLDAVYDVTAHVIFPGVPPQFQPRPEPVRNTVKQYSVGTVYEFDALKTTFEFQRLEGIRMDWYGQVEYRLAPFTPYIAYGQLYQDNERSNASATVGVRYDLLSNLSINAEYQYFQVLNSGSGLFISSPGNDDSAQLFTVMASFSF
ncbi:porin [Vibrio maritimus]|uniref:porin n=1 Tax=Vibrio maritimus TaxID=990268 RepID=UPI0037351A88